MKSLLLLLLSLSMNAQAYALSHHTNPSSHHQKADTEQSHRELGCCSSCSACSFELYYHEHDRLPARLPVGQQVKALALSCRSFELATRIFKPPRAFQRIDKTFV